MHQKGGVHRGRKPGQHHPGLAVRRGRHLDRGVVHPGQVRQPQQLHQLQEGILNVGEIVFKNHLPAGAGTPFACGILLNIGELHEIYFK